MLDHFKNVEKIPGIERRINYVIPMFQGEVHLYARPEIKTIKDLAGKKVGFNTVGSAANYTGDIVFKRLGIQVEQVFQNNALAIEAMRRGELAAIVHVVGKPNDLFSKLKPEPGFHFLPIEYGDKFSDYYVPAELTSADYPNLIPPGQSVDTISVSALLAVYNWKSDTDRYRRCVRFIEYLFNRFDKLRENPYQPGWRQINLAGTIPGWTRFPPTQELIDKVRRAPRSIPAWLASRRHAQHPTAWPSRSACSASSWSGASSRSDNEKRRGYRLREAQLYGLDQAQGDYSAAPRSGTSTARAAGSRLQRLMQFGVTACVALGIIVIGDGTPARPAEAQQRITSSCRRSSGPSRPPGRACRSRSTRPMRRPGTASCASAACRSPRPCRTGMRSLRAPGRCR